MCCLLVSDILCEELGGGDGGRRSKAVPRSPLHGCFILHWVKERVRVYGASCEWAGHWCALSGRARERTPGSRRSAYRLHLSINISPSKKKKRIKRAGQNPKKEQIDRLEKISAPNFEGPQWARITASVTITLKRSSPTPAMRSGVLLLIAGLLGFGMWTEFLQFLYASYSPVSYFRRREKCAECLPRWYPAVVYWKYIGY